MERWSVMAQAETTKERAASPVTAAGVEGEAREGTLRGVGADKVEVYWAAGCTACLRMKEFVEASGIPYDAVNVGTDPDAAARLTRAGLKVPAILVGERWTQGVDLAKVAELLGVEYTPPVI